MTRRRGRRIGAAPTARAPTCAEILIGASPHAGVGTTMYFCSESARQDVRQPVGSCTVEGRDNLCARCPGRPRPRARRRGRRPRPSPHTRCAPRRTRLSSSATALRPSAPSSASSTPAPRPPPAVQARRPRRAVADLAPPERPVRSRSGRRRPCHRPDWERTRTGLQSRGRSPSPTPIRGVQGRGRPASVEQLARRIECACD